MQRAILSSLLSKQEYLLEYGEQVLPHLTDNYKKLLFRAIECLAQGKKLDAVTLAIGTDLDYDFVDSVFNSPKTENVDYLVHNFVDAKQLEEMKSLIRLIIESDMGLSEAIQHIDDVIIKVSNTVGKTTEVYKMGNTPIENEPEIVQKKLYFGMPTLDLYTGGVRNNDLVVVVAEPKIGKSTILLNWTKYMGVNCKVPILYVDTEMNSREQEDRLLSIMTQIPEELISDRNLTKENLDLINEKREILKSVDIHHVYMPQISSVSMISNLVKEYQLRYGIQALFLDYLKIPAEFKTNTNQSKQEYQLFGYLTSGLKDMAGILEVPVITAAQENRTGIGSDKKDAGNVGGSGRILQNATKLFFLRNKTDEELARYGPEKGNQILSVKYQRKGRSNCDDIHIAFRQETLTQREVVS